MISPDPSPDQPTRQESELSRKNRPVATPPESVALPRTVTFDELSLGGNELLIQHRGQQYRLRTTRNGGLILNK